MERRLVAAIACRNQGSRLYGKPLQNLEIEKGVRIIDNIIDCLQSLGIIDEIILGISEGQENEVFRKVAEQKGLRFIIGDEKDVLSRLIQCGELGEATDVFRITSESPFLFFEPVVELWEKYQAENLDAVFMEEVVDGCGFEIISLKTLQIAHRDGEKRHRSEFCSLYIRENLTRFKVLKTYPPASLVRKDLRLTVDHPEDLVICRNIYNVFKTDAPRIPVQKIVDYLDSNPHLKELVAPFTEAGYSTMNL